MKTPRDDDSVSGSAPVNDLSVVVPPLVLTPVDWLAMALLVIGGLNWGVMGLAGRDAVAMLLGTGLAARMVYVLFGLAAVVALARAIGLARARR